MSWSLDERCVCRATKAVSGERKKIELIFGLGDRIVILGFRNACLELMCGVPRLFGAITMDETLLIVIVSIGGGSAMVCAIVAGAWPSLASPPGIGSGWPASGWGLIRTPPTELSAWGPNAPRMLRPRDGTLSRRWARKPLGRRRVPLPFPSAGLLPFLKIRLSGSSLSRLFRLGSPVNLLVVPCAALL